MSVFFYAHTVIMAAASDPRRAPVFVRAWYGVHAHEDLQLDSSRESVPNKKSGKKSAKRIPHDVHSDDSIRILKQKLAVHVFGSDTLPEDVHCWVGETVRSAERVRTIARIIMQSSAQQQLSVPEVLDAAATVLDAPSAARFAEKVGRLQTLKRAHSLLYRECVDLLQGMLPFGTEVAVGFSYQDPATFSTARFVANPYRRVEADPWLVTSDGLPKYAYLFRNEDAATLESVAWDPATAVLHATTLKHVVDMLSQKQHQKQHAQHLQLQNGYLRKYFPMKKFGAVAAAANVSERERLDKVRRRLVSYEAIIGDVKAFQHGKAVQEYETQIYVARASAVALLQEPLSDDAMDALFREHGRASRDVPIVSYHDGLAQTVRVYKAARIDAAYRAKIEQLARETQLARDKSRVMTLVLSADDKPDGKSLHVVVRADSVTVHARYGNYRFVSESEYESDCNTALQTATETLGMAADWIEEAAVEEAEYVAFVSTRTAKTPPLTALTELASDMWPFFAATEEQASTAIKQTLLLRYKRVGSSQTSARGFVDQLRSAVSHHGHTRDKKQVARLASKALGISMADAESYIDRWTMEESLDLQESAQSPNSSQRSHSRMTVRELGPSFFKLSLLFRQSSLNGRGTMQHAARACACFIYACHSHSSSRKPSSGNMHTVDDDSTKLDDDVQRDIDALLAETDASSGASGAAAERSRTQPNAAEPSEPVATTPGDRVLDALYRADAPLFLDTARQNYAVVCQITNKRQPIVITEEDKKRIDRDHPGSYTSSLRHGSTKEKAASNIYICPKVWCPKSRVSLTESTLRERGCPDPDEQAVVFESSYFPKGEQRHVGLLNERFHRENLQMPCCFKKSGEDSDKDDKSGSSKYLMKSNVYPLQEGRYGMLPDRLAPVFASKACGTRDDGGLITRDTQCYVRVGVKSHPQKFMQCLATVLGVEGGADALLDLIARNLTPAEFAVLNGGSLCRSFMPTEPGTAVGESEFAAWLETPAGKRYRERRCQMTTRRPTKDKDEAAKKRELLLFASMQRFLQTLKTRYLREDPNQSQNQIGHDALLHLCHMKLGWLNEKNLNLLVIEKSDHGDSMSPFFVANPVGTDVAKMYDLKNPFAVMVLQDIFYEPLAVVMRKRVQREFSYGADKPIRVIVDLLRGYSYDFGGPTSVTATTSAGYVRAVLRMHGVDADCQVLDHALQLRGLASTTSSLYVPLDAPTAAWIDRPDAKVLFRDELFRADIMPPCREKPELIQALFEELGRQVTLVKQASLATLVTDTGEVVACFRTSGTASKVLPAEYARELDAMVGAIDASDPRAQAAASRMALASTTLELAAAAAARLTASVEHRDAFAFLTHKHNPFPIAYRRRKLERMLAQVKLTGVPALALEAVLNPDLAQDLRARKATLTGHTLGTDDEDVLVLDLSSSVNLQTTSKPVHLGFATAEVESRAVNAAKLVAHSTLVSKRASSSRKSSAREYQTLEFRPVDQTPASSAVMSTLLYMLACCEGAIRATPTSLRQIISHSIAHHAKTMPDTVLELASTHPIFSKQLPKSRTNVARMSALVALVGTSLADANLRYTFDLMDIVFLCFFLGLDVVLVDQEQRVQKRFQKRSMPKKRSTKYVMFGSSTSSSEERYALIHKSTQFIFQED